MKCSIAGVKLKFHVDIRAEEAGPQCSILQMKLQSEISGGWLKATVKLEKRFGLYIIQKLFHTVTPPIHFAEYDCVKEKNIKREGLWDSESSCHYMLSICMFIHLLHYNSAL